MVNLDESSSGFGDESPILFRPNKELCGLKLYSNCNLNLDELYKELLLYLKKSRTISRTQLKLYQEEVIKMNPTDTRNRWLVMKIKGILNYILKKRAAFQLSIAKGEITIYQKSVGEPAMSPQIPLTATFRSCRSANCSADFPSNMLTNQNFYSPELTNDTESNYSQDLFPESLHNMSQTNFQMFKNLTSSPLFAENPDSVFKVPAIICSKIDKACKIHESLEEDFNAIYSSLPSSTPTVPGENQQAKKDETVQSNVFDDADRIGQEFIDNMTTEKQIIQNLIQEIVSKLINLQTDCAPMTLESNKMNVSLNESLGSSKLRTFHSEENIKIIRETCAKFKEKRQQKQF